MHSLVGDSGEVDPFEGPERGEKVAVMLVSNDRGEVVGSRDQGDRLDGRFSVTDLEDAIFFHLLNQMTRHTSL